MANVDATCRTERNNGGIVEISIVTTEHIGVLGRPETRLLVYCVIQNDDYAWDCGAGYPIRGPAFVGVQPPRKAAAGNPAWIAPG
jgi:hypothetical protein